MDWTPFFHAWEFRGVFPDLLEREGHADPRRASFTETPRERLGRLATDPGLEAHAVYGFFPAAKERRRHPSSGVPETWDEAPEGPDPDAPAAGRPTRAAASPGRRLSESRRGGRPAGRRAEPM